MKKALCCVAFLVLAAQVPLWCYDQSPSSWQVVPECIWAPATGGGTWVTEIQITTFATCTGINVYFFNVDGYRGPFTLYGSLSQWYSIRYSNILQSIDALDPGVYNYYGKVGAVWFEALGGTIEVQAKTVNGNYGKTFPSLGVVESNSVGTGRPMVIQDLVQTSTYRTFVGAFNTSNSTTFVVTFRIISASNTTVGVDIVKTMAPLSYISFNPFVEAGVGSGTYSNCWLYIFATSGDATTRGVMCFGSIANNYTNDTYALIPRMFN